jgi:hypothetical protein
MERSVGGRIALVASLLLILLGTAPADAKQHKRPKSSPVTSVSSTKTTSADNEQVTTSAACPSGLIAVGGGFLAPVLLDNAGAPTDINLVYESRREGDGAWVVSGVREDAGSPGPEVPLTAIVDCRSAKLAAKKPAGKKAAAAKKKQKKRLRIIDASASAVAAPADEAQASASATCPKGTTAIGGGFAYSPTPVATDPNAFAYVWSNHRNTPTSWIAAISNAGKVARTVTSHAYCAAGLKVTETSSAVSLPASGTSVVGATVSAPPCPAGKALLGGGYDNTQATKSTAIAVPTAFGPVKGSWQLDTLNFTPTPGAIRSIAYCA